MRDFLKEADKQKLDWKNLKDCCMFNGYNFKKVPAYKTELADTKTLKKEIEKEYKNCKKEHCDNCETGISGECNTCKPEFNKLRRAIKICGKILNDVKNVGGESQ